MRNTTRVLPGGFFDYEKPITTCIYDVEGAVTYKALLYVPGRAPYDLHQGLQGAAIFLRRSRMDNCEDLLPDHFRFVRGIGSSRICPEYQPGDAAAQPAAAFIAGNLERK